MKEKIKRKGPIETRVFARCVAGPNGCIVWTGFKDKDGYGKIKENGKGTGVHRAILQVKLGRKLNDGEQSLHECDNPSCCNPNHLWAGSTQDNTADKTKKGRALKGESLHLSKLTEDQVREIRQLRFCGVPGSGIAKWFGITNAVVYQIANRKTWKHI